MNCNNADLWREHILHSEMCVVGLEVNNSFESQWRGDASTLTVLAGPEINTKQGRQDDPVKILENDSMDSSSTVMQFRSTAS